MTKLQCPVLNYKHLTHSSRYTNYQFSWSLLKLSFEIEHWHIYNIMMNPILSRSFFFFFAAIRKMLLSKQTLCRIEPFQKNKNQNITCLVHNKENTNILHSAHCLKICAKRKAQRTIDTREVLGTQYRLTTKQTTYLDKF